MSGPWIKFYPTDWTSDPKLGLCSLAARGLWMEMLCLMHEAEPRGALLINGRRPTDRQVAILGRCTIEEARAALTELEEAGVLSREPDGTIISRRIKRDTEKAARDKENGGKGGNPTLTRNRGSNDNPPDNPPDKPTLKGQDKAQIPEARKGSEANASGSALPKERDPIEVLWDDGLEAMLDMGVPDRSARSNIGRWLADTDNDAARVLAAIQRSRDHGTKNPIPLIGRILRPLKAAGPAHAKTLQDVARDLAERFAEPDAPPPLRLVGSG